MSLFCNRTFQTFNCIAKQLSANYYHVSARRLARDNVVRTPLKVLTDDGRSYGDAFNLNTKIMDRREDAVAEALLDTKPNKAAKNKSSGKQRKKKSDKDLKLPPYQQMAGSDMEFV